MYRKCREPADAAMAGLTVPGNSIFRGKKIVKLAPETGLCTEYQEVETINENIGMVDFVSDSEDDSDRSIQI